MRTAYKCEDCAAVFATETSLDVDEIKCGICNGFVRHFGVVTAEDLAAPMELRCNCDDRCTCAAGPKCNCRCGGINHMAGISAVTMAIYHDHAVTLTCSDTKTTEKHKKIGLAVQEARSQALKRRAAIDGYEQFQKGVFIERASWEKLFYGNKALSKAWGASPKRKIKIYESVFVTENIENKD